MPDIVHSAKIGVSGGTAETGIRFELPDKQQHTASFLPVMDIPLSGGRIFGCGALALPVKQVLVDEIADLQSSQYYSASFRMPHWIK